MDLKKKLTLAWTVAGILAVLLAVSLFFLMNPEKSLNTVLEEGKQDVTEQRADVAAACEGDSADKAKCDAELDELAQILREFSRDIDKATTTAAENAQ